MPRPKGSKNKSKSGYPRSERTLYTPAGQPQRETPNIYTPAPLVERINIELTDVDYENLNQWCDQRKSQVETDRTDFLDRQQRYLVNWDDFITSTRKGPWKECSNLNLPLTAIMVKSLHARFYEIFTNPQTTILNPREKTDDEFVFLMQRLRKWYMWDYINGYRGIRGFAREAFWDVVTVGFGIGVKDFEIKERKMIVLEENQIKDLKREVADLEPQMKELASQKQELETDEEMATKRIDVSPYKEVQKLVKIFEGTSMRTVPWENAYFRNDMVESNDMDSTDYVMLQTQMSSSEIRMKAKRGIYDEECAQRVSDMTATYDGTPAAQIKQQKENLTGINKVQSMEKGQHIVEHIFATYDIDNDGIDEEIVISRCNKEILNINYLDKLSPTGMRPVIKFDCFSKPRQAYSRGVPEYLYPIQEEVNLYHNRRQDSLTLQTTPFGVYRAGSSLKREPLKISPGKIIPVDDVNDLKLMSWNANAQIMTNEQQMLWQYAERMVSVTALSQGAMPETVGALRSTSGVLTMLKQMQKEFVSSIDQNADSWKKMEKMILYDLDTRISDQVKLRILGPAVKDPATVLKKYVPLGADGIAITSQFDLEIDVASAINSEEIRRNDAQQVMQTTLNPSIAHQLGIVNAKGVYESLRKWYLAMGEDPNSFITKPQFTDEPLTLYQEIQICGQGEVPPMAMQDDHQLKAQDLLRFMQVPEFAEAIAKGIYIQAAPQFIQQAAQKHLMLAQALQPKGMPNPSGANDANLNEQQAGTSPQQGGQDPQKTTSRELPPKKEGMNGRDQSAANPSA